MAESEKARIAYKRIVDTQEISPADAARMARERETINAQLRDARAAHDAADQVFYSTEVAVSRKVEDVQRVLAQYTQLGTQVQILPITARHASNINYELTLNLNGMRVRM